MCLQLYRSSPKAGDNCPLGTLCNSPLCDNRRSKDHSAHIGDTATVYYPLDPLFGQTLKVQRIEERVDGGFVRLLCPNGRVRSIDMWKLHPSAGHLYLGTPVVSVTGLKVLSDLLIAQKFRRSFPTASDSWEVKDEETDSKGKKRTEADTASSEQYSIEKNEDTGATQSCGVVGTSLPGNRRKKRGQK